MNTVVTNNARIGTALVGGYLLGRTKKAKLAVGLGMFLAGRKLDLDPRRLGKRLAESPVVGSLNDQVRTELVDATRTAAVDALTQRASGLADTLRQRTAALESSDSEGDAGDVSDAGGTEDVEEDADRAADSYDGEDDDRGGDKDDYGGGRANEGGRGKRGASGSGAAKGGRKAASAARKAPATARKRTRAPKRTAAAAARKGGGEDK